MIPKFHLHVRVILPFIQRSCHRGLNPLKSPAVGSRAHQTVEDLPTSDRIMHLNRKRLRRWTRLRGIIPSSHCSFGPPPLLALRFWLWLTCAVGWLLCQSAPRSYAAPPPNLVFSCQASNDLYRVLAANGQTFPRFDSPALAVAQAPERAGVLILANSYPTRQTPVDKALFETAARKKLRLYLEFPSQAPGLSF